MFPPLLHNGKDDIVCRIGFNRALLLNAFTWSKFSAFPDLLGGQLLVYFPDHDSDMYDGQSEVHSNGFFDVFNTPPCDTWVGYFFDPHSVNVEREYLLAYVPKPLVKLANKGINENVDGCIMWLADAPVAMRDRLGSGPIA